ncbi:sensor histidine kinase [Desulfitibacter alkalitolerans]|uniref:sensor histidine kinase n=1 Tax=Desulfitibacter alkalitolerans TaxID=264641 RepID=UPI000688301D|nr:PocR ligand-binding domain-containing protein [Desulfitibacter alkalitolerans]
MKDSIYGLKVDGYLREVIDISRLQEVIDKFSAATSMGAVVSDVDGIPITKPSNFTNFCRLIRSSKEGLKGCYKSDSIGGKIACKCRDINLYKCHCGLNDMATPLIIDDVYWGAVLSGQVLFEKPSPQKLRQIRQMAVKFDIDPDRLENAFKEIQVVSETTCRAAGELMQIVAKYIVEMSVSKITHQKFIQQVEDSAKKERVMHQLELSALQSQINPHFLFNTLNAISRLALIEGAGKTEEMIHALARLLRRTLQNIDKLAPLHEEIEYIENYLFIQKTRYGDQLDFRIEIEEDVLEVMIPIMTLQPIVENAIVHGIEPREDIGNITIEARKIEGMVCIKITDNGIGMDTERIMQSLDSSRSLAGLTKGLGLRSVKQRLKHCYNCNDFMEIFSEVGKGTIVTIWIPLQINNTKEMAVKK